MTRRFMLAIALLAAMPAGAAADPQQPQPTFDCAKVSGQVETVICKDAGLIALDRKMAGVYAAAMKKWPANIASTERARQRGWIKGRNDCWKESDVRACVEESYRTRMVELQIGAGLVTVPKPVEFACTGGPDQPFTASYYAQTEPASAVLTFGNDQVITFATPVASGTRYVAANVELREHQGQVTVSWYGTSLTCRAR